ncbi:MAG: hypothetical protein ACJ8FY_28255 [Gemmataceae bacterium]
MDRQGSASAPPLWPYLILCAGLAVWIDLGNLHQCQHSDSILPVQISLYRWTLFYWENDRIGMLVPLLAMPIKHPLGNLLFQDGLNVGCGLAAFFLLARYFLRDRTYPLVATVGLAGFLALPTPYYRFEYLVNTYYGLWLCLGLGGLLLLELQAEGAISWPRRLLALLMLLVCHWVYCTAFLFLGPLVVTRFLAAARSNRAAGEAGYSLLFLAIGYIAGLLLMQTAPSRPTNFSALPMEEWPHSLQALIDNTVINLGNGSYLLALAALGALALLGLAFSGMRRHAGPFWRAAAALTAVAIALGLFMATREWVGQNQYMFRYLLPSCLYLQAALTIAAIGTATAALSEETRRRMAFLSPILLVAAIACSYGMPSLKGVRDDLAVHHYPRFTSIEAFKGMAVEELVDAHCTHIAGDYWQVWPTVFSANLALRDRGEQRIIWGISLRSKPTRRYWSRVPWSEIRVAVPVDDPLAESYLKESGLPPLVVTERRTTFWILRPLEATGLIIPAGVFGVTP